MEQIKENGYLTPIDIAEALNIGPLAIYRHCASGHLPAQKIGRRWQIKPEDGEAFIENYRAGKVGRKGFASPKHPLYGKRKWEGDPNSLASQGKYTHIFLPCTPEHGSWLKGLLTGEERLAILTEAALAKEAGYTGEWIQSQIKHVYETGQMPPLLPGNTDSED